MRIILALLLTIMFVTVSAEDCKDGGCLEKQALVNLANQLESEKNMANLKKLAEELFERVQKEQEENKRGN